MDSLFQVIAHEDSQDQTRVRKAMALATQRVEDGFGKFLKSGNTADRAVRFELVSDDVRAVVVAACDQAGLHIAHDDIFRVITQHYTKEQDVRNERVASVAHESRRPKMCPYHSEVTDISLATGEPAAGFNAMAQHAWGPNHCQGEGWEGGRCGFKREMVTQTYWDQKAERAEERRLEREEQQRLEQIEQESLQQPVQELNEVTDMGEPENPEVPVDEPSAVGEGAEPMLMAAGLKASGASEASFTKEAPGSEHMKGVGEKRNRQYEHIKERCLDDGEDEERCKEMAARTVNKQRSEHGETKDSRTATDTTGLDGPEPRMDKRKWTPKTVGPLQGVDDAKGRNPTKRKDVVAPISDEPNRPDNESKPEEIGGQVTEHQDVTKEWDLDRSGQSGTFGGGDRSAVSNILSREAIQAALVKSRRG